MHLTYACAPLLCCCLFLVYLFHLYHSSGLRVRHTVLPYVATSTRNIQYAISMMARRRTSSDTFNARHIDSHCCFATVCPLIMLLLLLFLFRIENYGLRFATRSDPERRAIRRIRQLSRAARFDTGESAAKNRGA